MYLSIRIKYKKSSNETTYCCLFIRAVTSFETVCWYFLQKDVPQTPRLSWEQKAHTVAAESLQRSHNAESRTRVLQREWGGSAAQGVGEVSRRQFTKLLLSFMCTTDFPGVGVLEEPHDFVFHLYHYLSFNILPWVIHFLRGMNINVELLLAVFYQSYVFSHVFFLSLIMSTFIKYYSHSVHNFFWIHIFLKKSLF